MMPRSQGTVPGKHGTFDDCIARLPDIAALGFDVVYLTPIHPIGMTNRKGKNNSLKSGPDDPGSPYAIGSRQGGHDAVHPELGTLDDFRRFVDACRALDMEVALDFAIQCSPDHPWLKEHPEWFRRRPDGSIRYAENPPKKYEDIVNPDFYCADRIALWQALRDVVLFWVQQGVRIFRVDNPHTKPFPFWEWLIHEVQARDPERAVPVGGVFAAEDHEGASETRLLPVLHLLHLAHPQGRTAGVSQRDHAPSRTGLFPAELLRLYARHPAGAPAEGRAVDVQVARGAGGHAVGELRHLQRLRTPRARADSQPRGVHQLGQIRDQSPRLGQAGQIKGYIARLNRLRRENAALRQTSNLRFAQVDDSFVIGFVKEWAGRDSAVAVAIALNGHGPRTFWLHFGEITIGPDGNRAAVRSIVNLTSGERHMIEWGGVRLTINPSDDPALLFRCEMSELTP